MAVVCLGEALIDLTPHPDSSLANTGELTVRIGGAPLNVAIHLKRAGIDSRFLGTLSSDGFGDRIRALLESEGVTRYPITAVYAPTRLAVIEYREDRPPFRFYGDQPADSRLTLKHVDEALGTGITALYVSSLLLTNRSSALAQQAAIQRAREAGNVLVVTDPNPRLSAWKSRSAMVNATGSLLRDAHLTKISLDDARSLGWPDDPERLLDHLKQRTSGAVIITHGKDGCWFEDDSGLLHVPASPVVEIDPTGAGDAFFATVIAGVLHHGQLSPEILRAASNAGAIVAARHGTHLR